MRRLIALFGAIALTASLTGSSLAAVPRSSFTGDFDLLPDGGGPAVGHITAELFEPTERRLVPGAYDFKGVPGNQIRESHSVIGSTQFWYDPGNLGGSNVAFAEGAECIYYGPGDTFCHEIAVMFIDVLDPSHSDQVAFGNRDPDTGEWAFDWWFWVGKGDFVLKLAGS